MFRLFVYQVSVQHAESLSGVVVEMRRSHDSLNTTASNAAIIGSGKERRWKMYIERRRASSSFSFGSHISPPVRPYLAKSARSAGKGGNTLGPPYSGFNLPLT